LFGLFFYGSTFVFVAEAFFAAQTSACEENFCCQVFPDRRRLNFPQKIFYHEPFAPFPRLYLCKSGFVKTLLKRVQPLNLLEEQLLLLRLKNHDRAAAERLVDAHYRQVYYFLFSLCHRRDWAQDLVQETFFRFWKTRDRFENRCRLKTWLFQIAWHVWLDEVKKKNVRGDQVPIDQIEISTPAEETDATIENWLQDLSSEQRDVLLLFYQHDLSQQQIATILQIPLGTVKSRLYNARLILKKEMKHGFV
jgi:RNA polymerase sigma-70 factor, ECF subfamily